MNHWFKYLLILVLAASIPLEGLAAVTMPLCSMPYVAMGSDMAMNSSTMDDGMARNQPCDKHCQECCVSQNSNQSKETSDQKCFVCYLSAIQRPVAPILAAVPDIANKFPPLLNEHYQIFPPALYRPPKSLSA